MFERYTEKARRVIFFARYEASQFGSPYIETEHLLLGLLRENKALTNRFLRSHSSVESIRNQIEKHTTIREKVSTSVDLPISDECKRVLAYSAEEAERLGHKHLGTEHLLLGLLREESSFAAAMLKERGVQLDVVREELARAPQEQQSAPTRLPLAPLSDFTQDLTLAAMNGQLEPVVGRDSELDAIVEVLCGSRKPNPILIGDHGTGKTAIVEELAQRIANGAVPDSLAERRLVAVDAGIVAGWALSSRNSEERLNQGVKAFIDATDVILFINDLHLLVATFSNTGTAISNSILRHWLQRGKIQSIAACTPSGYDAIARAAPWVAECFRAVYVHALDEEKSLDALQVRKHRLEAFHGVTFADEALACAIQSSGRYLPDDSLPGKALELLDAAGARVKLRQSAPPAEVAECMKKIKFVVHRMDSAIANHEFEKAKFYSDEERKERENLRVLREKYNLEEPESPTVTADDVEAVIARWAGYPFRP